jgi:hypothetical protein
MKMLTGDGGCFLFACKIRADMVAVSAYLQEYTIRPTDNFSPASGINLDIRKCTPLHTLGQFLPYIPSFRVMMHAPGYDTKNPGAWPG